MGEKETEIEKPHELQVCSRKGKFKKNCQSLDPNIMPLENIGNSEPCLTPFVISS